MKPLSTVLLLMICTQFLLAQEITYPEKNKEQVSSFELLITGIPEKEGEIRIAVFDSKEEYKKKKEPLYAVVLPVKDSQMKWLQEGLPFGSYAIAVYHDQNKNGKLDSNLLGIPKEAYGFSNNARGRFGPATWEDAHFEVSSSETEHTIELN